MGDLILLFSCGKKHHIPNDQVFEPYLLSFFGLIFGNPGQGDINTIESMVEQCRTVNTRPGSAPVLIRYPRIRPRCLNDGIDFVEARLTTTGTTTDDKKNEDDNQKRMGIRSGSFQGLILGFNKFRSFADNATIQTLRSFKIRNFLVCMKSNLTITTLLLLTLLSTHMVDAQRKWDDKYYTSLTDDTFRDFKLFKQPINLKKIDYKTLNAAVFFVSNEARLEQGLQPLAYNPNLEIMAWNHSRSMGEKDFFDHVNVKDKKRKEPKDRARLAGISNPVIAENISSAGGYRFSSYLELADHIIDGWIDSPPHRKTLYGKDALQLGCGVYYYTGLWQKNRALYKQGSGFWLATQNFQLYETIKSTEAKDKGPK